MTTNPLAVLNQGQIELSELEMMILEEAALDAAAFDPIPTKITIAPGGINAFKASSGEVLPELNAIIAISQKARAYWPEKGSGSPPLCASLDSSAGSFNVDAPDLQLKAATSARDPHIAIRLLDAGKPVPAAFDCATCPLNKWGSIHQGNQQGKGKACKELRRLVILVDGWMQPALLTLPPTSIKSFDGYASALAQKKGAYFAVRTRIELEARKTANGDPYSIAVFTPVTKLTDPAQVKAVIAMRKEYAALVRDLGISPDEYDDSAASTANGDPYAEPDIDGRLPF